MYAYVSSDLFLVFHFCFLLCSYGGHAFHLVYFLSWGFYMFLVLVAVICFVCGFMGV